MRRWNESNHSGGLSMRKQMTRLTDRSITHWNESSICRSSHRQPLTSKLEQINGILPTRDSKSFFFVGKELGAGNYGKVNIVQKQNYNKIRFAMKEVPRERDYSELLQREFDILSSIDHPFLMSLVEAYYCPRRETMSLVLPLYEGGDVF